MTYGLYGVIVPILLDGIVKDYLKEALPEVNRKEFMRNLKREYRAMVQRTEDIGKDNIFRMTLYLACYGFCFYKADPELITDDIFAGFIHALSYSKLMEKAYKGKDAFSRPTPINMPKVPCAVRTVNIPWIGSLLLNSILKYRNITLPIPSAESVNWGRRKAYSIWSNICARWTLRPMSSRVSN